MSQYSGYSAKAFAELEADPEAFEQIVFADPEPLQPQLGRDGKMHQGGHGYDGEGVYAWNCICGEAESDLATDDNAALGLSEHLAEIEILAEVA